MSQPLPLTTLLTSPRLASLKRGNQLRATHEALWLRVVDPALRHSCRPLSLRGGVLTLLAADATTATQLRYLQRILIQQLKMHAEFRDLQRLFIQVGILPQPPKRRPKPLPKLSENTREHLKETAESLGKSELSEIFRRLASRGG